MRLFGEITKVEALDDGTIKVIGVASTGAVDEADETVLPAAMKAALPAYMRFGALREMHGMSAAGATLSAQVDDDGVTWIETHVVDPLQQAQIDDLSLRNGSATIDEVRGRRGQAPLPDGAGARARTYSATGTTPISDTAAGAGPHP